MLHRFFIAGCCFFINSLYASDKLFDDHAYELPSFNAAENFNESINIDDKRLIVSTYPIEKQTTLLASENEPELFTLYSLPPELIYGFILPHCGNTKVHHINRQFFSLVTCYKPEDMFLTGFEHKPTEKRHIGSGIYGIGIDFKKLQNNVMTNISSYIWYGLVTYVNKIPKLYWPFITDSRIDKIDLLFDTTIINQDAFNLNLILKNIDIDILSLHNSKIIGKIWKNLGLAFEEIKLNVLDLSLCYISRYDIKDLCLVLKNTSIHILDLTCNDINNQSFKYLLETLNNIDMLDLWGNHIGDENFKELYPESWVHHKDNKDFKDIYPVLKNTKIHTFDLECNAINVTTCNELEKLFSHIKFYF